MPDHSTIALTGVVKHVFAHRFTLDAGGETHLADLTPKGLEAFPLSSGLHVQLEGERRPSEIKVTRIGTAGRDAVDIHHKKPHHPAKVGKHDSPADPALAIAAVRAAGWTVEGDPRRKPKHFEVLARKDGGAWMEMHVDLNGALHKTKDADPKKWGVAAA